MADENQGVLGQILPFLVPYLIGESTKKDGGDIGDVQGEAFAASYPEIMTAIKDQMLPMAQKELDVQKEITPQQQLLQYQQLIGSEEAKRLQERFGDKYVPSAKDFAQIGADIDYTTRRGAAATDLDLMRLQAPWMADATMASLAVTDQPWLRARDAGSTKLGELLGSINLGGLSGGERAEVERMNARRNLQRGQTGGGGNLTAIENAMNFGSRLDQKRSQLGQALQTATNFMAGSRSGFDPVQATLGRTSGTNQGMANFQGVQPVKDWSSAGQAAPWQLAQGVVNQDNSFLGSMNRGMQALNPWLNANPWG